MLASVGTRGHAPYREVLTHGFLVDGEGKKMSKSLGNFIAPEQVIDKYGAEVLRLWVSAEDYRDDIRISEEILQRQSEAYRRIRNTARFILGNLFDFDPKKDLVGPAEMLEIDRFVLIKFTRLAQRIVDAYGTFDFHVIYHGIHNFCTVTLSAFYLDILKDRLYTEPRASKKRRAAQSAMYLILSGMTRLMAPILSFTAEEIWDMLPGTGKEPSVHLAAFPAVDESLLDDGLEARWDRLIEITDGGAEVPRGGKAQQGHRAFARRGGDALGAFDKGQRERAPRAICRGPFGHLYRVAGDAGRDKAKRCGGRRVDTGALGRGGKGRRRQVPALLELYRGYRAGCGPSRGVRVMCRKPEGVA